MLGPASKLLFRALARSRLLKKAASRYGMGRPSGPARRLVAGETIEEALDAVRALEARGLMHTLDYLGESATTLEEAKEATRSYLAIIDRVVRAGVGRNLSLKLTQLGLDADPACCVDNLRRILGRAERDRCFITFDMEDSAYTTATLDAFETLWNQGHRSIGTVLQASLLRSEADLERLLALGATVRIVKGAYREPKRLAYRKRGEIDAAFLRLADRSLARATYSAIATHDATLIEAVKRTAGARGVPPDRFEFQMLYGVRPDLQAALAGSGYRVRIYAAFSRDWFPYAMRRLGERPANVWLIARSLLARPR